MNDLQTKVRYLDSREVAEMTNKRHADLLRDIETYRNYLTVGQNAKLRFDEFFLESTYKTGTGKSYKNYQITKKGCELIAHKMTGKKGVQFTAEYINRFHDMEQQLKQPVQTQLAIEEPYQYHEKFYNGEQVITIKDLEHFTHLPYQTIRCCLRRNKVFRDRKDYYFLEKKDLETFKVNNPCIREYTSCLLIITKSGFLKLANLLKQPKDLVKFNVLECEKPKELSEKTMSKPAVGYSSNDEVRKLVSKIKNKITAINEISDLINRIGTAERKRAYIGTLKPLMQDLSATVTDLSYVGID